MSDVIVKYNEVTVSRQYKRGEDGSFAPSTPLEIVTHIDWWETPEGKAIDEPENWDDTAGNIQI